jgi:hypothetical protein
LKGALGLVGVIIIGAIGSGVWEVVLKPLSTFIRDILLNLITFGLESFRNDIYSSVASGYDQSPIIQLLHYFVLAAILAMIFFLMDLFFKRRELMEDQKRVLKELDDTLSEITNMGETKKKTQEEIRDGIIQARQSVARQPIKRFSVLLYFGALLCMFQATLLITSLIKTSYINSAISHYNQIVAISSPYYNATEIALHNSQYAQIKKKEDYLRLTALIEATIKNHGIVPPTFSAW